MTDTAIALTPTQMILAACEALKLTVDAKFIPLSQSRNAGGEHPTLNWSVAIMRNGVEILRTDYSAGSAYCPSYGAKMPSRYQGTVKTFQREAIAFECEHGRKASLSFGFGSFTATGEPIQPEHASVVWSLVQDASVLDAGGFKSWAADYGYDDDSIKAKAIYDDCIEHALKLRGAIGEEGLEALRIAGEDF
jgi:hypothetical protein